jgi:hypothetical protein
VKRLRRLGPGLALAGGAAPVWAQAVSADQRRADIAQCRSEFLARDRAYADAARHEAERRLDALAARAPAIDPTAFALELARIAALADNGHLTKARDFAEELPGLVPGELFVLTSPWTFSAAISVSGYLKQAALSRVHIVGEPVGDRLHGDPALAAVAGWLHARAR